MRPQTWLSGDGEPVIPCANGLLKTSDRTLMPHTPDYFGHFALSFDYDPTAPKPARWLQFVDEVMPGDPTAQKVLQEFLGYILCGRTDLQKALMLLGPKRCGKGTIDRSDPRSGGPRRAHRVVRIEPQRPSSAWSSWSARRWRRSPITGCR